MNDEAPGDLPPELRDLLHSESAWSDRPAPGTEAALARVFATLDLGLVPPPPDPRRVARRRVDRRAHGHRKVPQEGAVDEVRELDREAPDDRASVLLAVDHAERERLRAGLRRLPDRLESSGRHRQRLAVQFDAVRRSIRRERARDPNVRVGELRALGGLGDRERRSRDG